MERDSPYLARQTLKRDGRIANQRLKDNFKNCWKAYEWRLCRKFNIAWYISMPWKHWSITDDCVRAVLPCNRLEIHISTPPFLQNMFVAWNSHGVDVFLEHCVDVDGILWTV